MLSTSSAQPRSCSLGAPTRAPGEGCLQGNNLPHRFFFALLYCPHGSHSCEIAGCCIPRVVLLQCGGVCSENTSELAQRLVVTKKFLFSDADGMSVGTLS